MPKTSRKQNGADEKRIVDELLKDPSLDAIQIAEKTGLSRRKVWRVLQSSGRERHDPCSLGHHGTIEGREKIVPCTL